MCASLHHTWALGWGFEHRPAIDRLSRNARIYRSILEVEPLPVWESILTTVRNRPFQRAMGLYLMSWTAASIMAAVLVYYANYYLQVPDLANYMVLAAQGSAIAFRPGGGLVIQKI